jgi:Tfp pilus assembly protein PilP
MNTKRIISTFLFLLFAGCGAFADRPLERAEILQILQNVTSQPRKAWIPTGTIEAIHEEYRAPKTTNSSEISSQINQAIAEYQNNPNKRERTQDLQKMTLDAIPFNVRYRLSNEYTMTSTVTVKSDGDRFYWEINVGSRTDSVKPDKDLADNFMTEQFNLDWNTRRIFAWDGEKYTTYTSANHAVVDSRGGTPHVVNGPLTAGFIPWGYGHYTYENLSAVESSAVETCVDGQTQIHLTITNSDGTTMLFVMDPAKGYAVLSCTIETNGATTHKQYSGYQSVAGSWVPATILLEHFEAGTNRLLARDLWGLDTIDSNVPDVGSFDVKYEPDALIEYASYITDKPAMYCYSPIIDTDALLAGRLAYAADEGSHPQNCATAALKYTTSNLGKAVTDSQLAELVTDAGTSLLAMKQFARQLGLYCRTVTTDIDTLRGLDNCQVILHIPGKKHFVVLESIDNSFVRIVDLTKDRFYYRTDINFFGMDWPDGVALLISDEPIAGEFVEINDADLANITGGSGYTCTRLLQEYDVILCDYIGGGCEGYYQIYFERWGCESAESGSCTMTWFWRLAVSPCIEDPQNPFGCTITGDWTYYYMRACY